MMTQSGCFGQTTGANDTVDTIEEVSTMVDGIVADGAQGADTVETAENVLAQYCALMEQRVRLLTWIVIAIAIYLLVKEVKS